MNNDNEIFIRESLNSHCDYCGKNKNKYVSKKTLDNNLDICSDCVLVIYELMRKEILC